MLVLHAFVAIAAMAPSPKVLLRRANLSACGRFEDSTAKHRKRTRAQPYPAKIGRRHDAFDSRASTVCETTLTSHAERDRMAVDPASGEVMRQTLCNRPAILDLSWQCHVGNRLDAVPGDRDFRAVCAGVVAACALARGTQTEDSWHPFAQLVRTVRAALRNPHAPALGCLPLSALEA
jgi:hypothetical protein